jgi:cold shock CspA family protein
MKMGQKMKGILEQWNEERGYGFIKLLDGKERFFAHISKFDKTHKRPQVGDKLIFEITEGNDGKKQAVAITSVGGASSVRSVRHDNQIYRPDLKQKTSRSSRRYLVLSVLGIFLFLRYLTSGNQTSHEETALNIQPIEEPQPRAHQTVVSVSDSIPQYPKQENPYTTYPPSGVNAKIAHTPIAEVKRATPNATPTQSKPGREYQCDGRQYCSQMKSCEEATYFLNNCPNTKMDGKDGRGDGVPCESQWCH